MRDAIMAWARKRKLKQFMTLCPEGSRVLDVGVSRHIDGHPAQNYFLTHYPRNPRTYTGLGVQDLSETERRHPNMRLVRYDGQIFPFADNEFDWVYCNAVIEHVGDEAAQLLFINEMLRVSSHVYFTTSDRFFPIELHSKKLFLHWNREAFHKWAVRTQKPWLTYPALRLLSVGETKDLLNHSVAKSYQFMRGAPWAIIVVAHS